MGQTLTMKSENYSLNGVYHCMTRFTISILHVEFNRFVKYELIFTGRKLETDFWINHKRRI